MFSCVESTRCCWRPMTNVVFSALFMTLPKSAVLSTPRSTGWVVRPTDRGVRSSNIVPLVRQYGHCALDDLRLSLNAGPIYRERSVGRRGVHPRWTDERTDGGTSRAGDEMSPLGAAVIEVIDRVYPAARDYSSDKRTRSAWSDDVNGPANTLITSIDNWIRPSVLPSICPSVRPSAHPSVRPSVCPSFRSSVRPSVRPSARLSIQSTASPSVRLSIGPSVCQPIRLSTRPSVVRPSICPFVYRPCIHSSVDPFVRSFIHQFVRPAVQPPVRPFNRPTVRPSACLLVQSSCLRPYVSPSARPSVRPSLSFVRPFICQILPSPVHCPSLQSVPLFITLVHLPCSQSLCSSVLLLVLGTH